MTQSVGLAPGKILLVGEHAVVYGHPAIAIPLRGVSARAEVELTRSGEMEFHAADLDEHIPGSVPSERFKPLVGLANTVLRMFSEGSQGVRISLSSTIPIGRGMGSGAAVSVALVRGICQALNRKLSADQVAELALEAERAFHGTPSGVDTAVVSRNEPIYFVKGKAPQEIAVGDSTFRFLIADTGIESPTGKVVQEVRELRQRDQARIDSYFWELGSMATVAREIIRGGNPPELGACMTHSHSVLQSLGVSCEELDKIVEAAIEKGALGAKLSGAGRGGVAIVLIDENADVNALESELRMAGAVNVFETSLGPPEQHS